MGAATCPRASVLGPFYTNAQDSDAQGAGPRAENHGAQGLSAQDTRIMTTHISAQGSPHFV